MKDYKPRPKPKKSGNVGNTLIGIFIGLLLGLLIAAAIAIYMNKAAFPFSQQKPKPLPPDAKAPARAEQNAGANTGSTGERRFDFYDILPGKADATPRAAAGSDSPRPEPKAEAVLKDVFVLQAGAFQNPADADQRKARLAFIGLEATVEPVDLPDKGTWYRVKLGPYKSLSEVNFVRSKLAQEGVEATVLKTKDP